MITTVIFDIGKVLASWDWETTLQGFGFSEEEYQAIAEAVYRNPEWVEMDRGVLTVQEVTERFCQKEPRYAEDIRRVMQSSPRNVHQYPYAKPLLTALKERGLRLYYLSNWGKFLYEETKGELDFLELMDGGIFSYEVKLVKPSRWIYQELLERFQIDPAEALFIDDNQENVEAAAKLGIATCQFCNYEDALEELKKLGLI